MDIQCTCWNEKPSMKIISEYSSVYYMNMICVLSGDGKWANGNWNMVVFVSTYFEGFGSYFSPSVRSKLGFQVSVKILHPDPLVRPI